MTNENETNREDDKLGVLGCKHCLSRVPFVGQRYLDKWGDEWRWPDDNFVVRVRDGMVGNWYNGQGLTHLPDTPTS